MAQASPLSPFVEEKLIHDSNVFRLSPGVDPVPLIGTSERSDTYSVTTAGINLDLPVSRQRLLVAFSANKSYFQRFSALDSTGHEARAGWLWRAGDDASGELGYADTSALASFANIVGTAPDILRTRHAFFNGGYQATPRWLLKAGADGQEQRNSDAASQVNDVDIVNGETSLSYVTPAGSSLGLSAGAETGRFPNPQPVAGTLVDNAYRQNRLGLVAQWPVTAASRLSGRIDRVGRHYQELPERNFDGTTWRVQYDWKPGARFSLATLAQRDISPFEYVRSSFVLVKGVNLRPSYSATSKVDLSAVLDLVTRDYLGDPAVALGVSPVRSDRVRSIGALISYRPLRTVALQASFLHETRSSNIPFSDYTANVVSLLARLAF